MERRDAGTSARAVCSGHRQECLCRWRAEKQCGA
jgi:hypothetical protein